MSLNPRRRSVANDETINTQRNKQQERESLTSRLSFVLWSHTFNLRTSETMWSLGSEYPSAAWKASGVLLSLTWLSVIWVCVCVCVRICMRWGSNISERVHWSTDWLGWKAEWVDAQRQKWMSVTLPHIHIHSTTSSNPQTHDCGWIPRNKKTKTKKTSIGFTLRNIPHNLHALSASSQWKISTFSSFPVVEGGGGGVGPSGPDASDGPRSPRCRRRCLRQAGRRPQRWRSHQSAAGNLFNLFIYLLPTRLHRCQERVMSGADPAVTPPWPLYPCRFIKSSSFVARLLDLTRLNRGVEADEAVGKVTVELGRVRVLKGAVRSKLNFYWV